MAEQCTERRKGGGGQVYGQFIDVNPSPTFGRPREEDKLPGALLPVVAPDDEVCRRKEPRLWYKVLIVTAAFIAAVFMLTSMKLIYEQPDHFRYPLFITACHQIFTMAVAGLFLRISRGELPSAVAAEGQQNEEAACCEQEHGVGRASGRRHGPATRARSRIGNPVRSYWRRMLAITTVVGPVAFFGATCVAFANTALLYIYPSLHEMIQNLGPLWVIFVGKFIHPDRQHNMWTYASMGVVFVGGALCISGEFGGFSLLGVVMSNLAAAVRSLRLAAQERIFQGVKAKAPTETQKGGSACEGKTFGRSKLDGEDEEAPVLVNLGDAQRPVRLKSTPVLEDVQQMDSLTLVYYTAPFNCALFMLYSIVYEDILSLRSQEHFWENKVFRFVSLQLGASTYFYFGFSGFLASVFTLLAFLQVELVGGFICTMVSQLKTPAQIVVSWLIFGNPCTYQQLLGVALVCVGLQAYGKYGKATSSAAT